MRTRASQRAAVRLPVAVAPATAGTCAATRTSKVSLRVHPSRRPARARRASASATCGDDAASQTATAAGCTAGGAASAAKASNTAAGQGAAERMRSVGESRAHSRAMVTGRRGPGGATRGARAPPRARMASRGSWEGVWRQLQRGERAALTCEHPHGAGETSCGAAGSVGALQSTEARGKRAASARGGTYTPANNSSRKEPLGGAPRELAGQHAIEAMRRLDSHTRRRDAQLIAHSVAYAPCTAGEILTTVGSTWPKPRVAWPSGDIAKAFEVAAAPLLRLGCRGRPASDRPWS